MHSYLIELVRGDITGLEVDAIVNAANSSLLGGGGVDGAIHRVAGPQLLQECRTLGGCPPGEARVTKGYQLNSRYVIHTVGPVWHGGNQDEATILGNCYRNSLDKAESLNCSSIAFPNISTGVYGYPKEQAAVIAVSAVKSFIELHKSELRIIFCCFDAENYEHYARLLT
jgi:O-acetyl-ADP-ribose deacetylase